MSDLIERAFAAVAPDQWGSTEGAAVAPLTLTEIRRRLREGLCPGCGQGRDKGTRTLLCSACRSHVGYCARCEGVLPLDAFAPPRSSDGGMAHYPYCRRCARAAQREIRPVPPCPRCGGERVGRYRLCAKCRERWGYCSACRQIKALGLFGKAPPSRAPYRQQHTGRCKACDAARKAAQRPEPRDMRDDLDREPRAGRPVYDLDGVTLIARSVTEAAAALNTTGPNLHQHYLAEHRDGYRLTHYPPQRKGATNASR